MKRIAMFVGLVVIFGSWGCSSGESGKTKAEPSQNSSPLAAQYKLEIVFDGPWSFVTDTSKNRIVAIAPVVTGHTSLYLRATGSQLENPGLYDLILTGASGEPLPSTPNPAPRFVPETGDTISSTQLASFEQGVVADRYVINIPNTQSVQAVYNDQLAYSTTYSVPVPSVSKTYVTKIAFRYLVSSLDVQLKGNSTDGTITKTINDSIGSDGSIDLGIDAADDTSACDDGAKGTFLKMTSLLQKQLYVDFPGYLPSCQNEDPQNPRGLSKTSKEMTHAGFATMKADVLNGFEIVRKYLENLAKQTDSKEGSRQTLERLAKVEAGVKGWPESGPSNQQRAAFVSGLRDLHEFVGKVEIADKYRNKVTALVDQVGPFSLSGKNCKAPLMLFGVAP